ncbi:hypothetical protein MNBD_GAMMA01-1052 [hydrothermal vent metagenome]|uniref:Autotransporter domain-containing protein n=1 Tax=hydrothermal vent metagenome TaxID=652676 RepID=A0A3B0VAW7_9ZZZZ
MKFNRLSVVAKVVTLLVITFNSFAINLVTTNAIVSPDPIGTSASFVVSIDIINSTDASSAVDAQSISATITDFAIDANANFNFLPASETAGWTCMPDSSPVTILTCTKTFSPSQLPADDTTIENLAFSMTAGSLPIGAVAFNIDLQDTILGEEQPSNNQITINTSVAGGAGTHDLDFVDTATLVTYNATEGQNTPVLLDFQVTNLGSDIMGGGMLVSYDDLLFTFIPGSSVIPTGWSCIPVTGSVDCSTSNNIANSSLTDFQLAFSVPSFLGIYTFTGNLIDFTGTEINTANNAINTDVDVAAAGVPDMNIILLSPSALPVDITQGSTLATPFTFRLTNAGPTSFSANDIDVFFAIDTQFSVSPIQTTTAGWNCIAETGGFRCINQSYTMLPNVAVDFNAEITGYPTPTAIYTNVVEVTATDVLGLELNTTDNIAFLDVAITAPTTTDLELLKFAKDTIGGVVITDIPANTPFIYSIQVNNTSLTAANNVVVTDSLPLGIMATGHSSLGGWNCTIDTYINEFTSQFVSCSHPTIAASQPNFTDYIYLDVQGVTVGSKTNVAAVSSTEADSNLANNDNSLTPSIINISNVNPDINITKTFISGVIDDQGTDIAQQGSQVVYQVMAKNLTSGAASGSNITITDILPAGVTFVSFNPIGPNFNCIFGTTNNTLACTATSLPFTTASDGVEITVDVTGTIGQVVENIATVTADNDSNAANNSASSGAFQIVAPVQEVDLSIIKDAQAAGATTSTNSFVVGENFEYKLTIKNFGPNDAPIGAVEVIDSLPNGIDLNSVANTTGWNCAATTGTTVSCVNTMVIPALIGTLDLIIPVSSQIANSYTNSADVALTLGSTVVETNTSNNNASFVVNIGTVSGNITFTKTVAGGVTTGANQNFAIGDTIIYTLLVQNTATTNSIADLRITDILDTNFISFTNVNIIQSAANFTCAYDDVSQVSCDNLAGNPFLPGDSFEVEIQATAVSAGNNISNTAQVSSVSTGDNFSSNTVLIDIDSGLLVTTLLADKEALIAGTPVLSVPKGTAFTYRVSVTNTGDEDAINVTMVDDMPAGVSVAGISSANWLCTSSGQQYTCSFAVPLTPAASTFIEFNVNDNSASAVTQLTNNVSFSAANALSSSSSNTVSLTQVGLSVDVMQNPDPVLENSAFDLIVDTINTGSEELQGIQIVNTLPADFSYNISAINGATCNITSLVITCTLDSPVAVATTNSLIIPVQAVAVVDTSATYTNMTVVSGTNFASTITRNTVLNVNTTTPTVADLKVTKTASASTVISGSQFNWNIEVLNQGPESATNVVINDVLPTGFELVSVTTTKGNCQSDITVIDCDITTLENQEVVMITITGNAVLEYGVLDNIATVTADTNDSDISNNSDIASVIVDATQESADLSINLSSGGDINQGESTTLDIQTNNNGPDSASTPIVNIVVTGLLENVSVSQTSDWNCQSSGFIINCEFNNTTMAAGLQSALQLTIETSPATEETQNISVTASITSSTSDPDTTNNSASSSIVVTGIPTAGDILDAMRAALGGTASPQVDRAIRNVSSYCGRRYFVALEGLCAEIYQTALAGNREAIREFAEQITPNEVIGQSSSVAEIATAQFRNVGARLSQLRGGGGGSSSGFSTAGLNARYGGGSIPLGMLSYLNQSEDEATGISSIDGDFISPWGFFVNGTISMGERDATGRELGFDFDTFGLTAGFDYRLDANKVIGIALGYASFDSKIEKTAKLESTGITLTGYGSFYVNDNFYIDARISYGKPDFNQSRNIDFTIGETQIQRTAIGKTDANQYTVAMSAGYNFNKNAWNITPNASFSYVKTNINGFTETGAGAFNFIFSEQAVESLVWSTGIKLSKAISLKTGVLTPQFDFDYNYESKNDGINIEARFIQAPDDEIFIIETDDPDRSYGSAGLGFVYITANGKQAYINYRSIIGLEGFSRGTFNLGARFEF